MHTWCVLSVFSLWWMPKAVEIVFVTHGLHSLFSFLVLLELQNLMLCNVSGQSTGDCFVKHLWCALYIFLRYGNSCSRQVEFEFVFFFKNQIGDSIVTHACFTLFSLVMGNTFLRQVEFELVQFFLKVKLEIVLLGIQVVWTVIFLWCMLEAVKLVQIMFNTPGVYCLFSYVILAWCR